MPILTVEIDATPAEVWAVLADFGNIYTWNPGVKASRPDLGPDREAPGQPGTATWPRSAESRNTSVPGNPNGRW